MSLLMIPLGTYKKDGEDKTNFVRVGKIVTKEGGKQSIILEPMIANYLKGLFGEAFVGWINIFEDKKKEEESGLPSTEGDLPF